MLCRTGLILGALLLVALAALGTTGAHGVFVSSDPAANSILSEPPRAVTITVSEAVDPASPTLRVSNASGVRFDEPPVVVTLDGRSISVGLAPNGPGIYTVTWSIVSAVDGHLSAGFFSYAVQNSDGSLPGPLPFAPATAAAPISPSEIALRFVGFLGLAVAFGSAVLTMFVWLPAGRDPDAREALGYGLGLQALLLWGRLGAFGFGVGMVGLLLLATGFETPGGLERVAGSPYLLSVILGLGIAVAIFLALSVALAHARSTHPEASRAPARGALILSFAAIFAISLGTHAAATAAVPLSGILANAAHLTGVAMWVGGLAGLVAVRGLLRDAKALPLARYAFAGFSRLAGYAILLVIASGTGLALLLVGGWEALGATGYGWVVLVKMALVVPMIALGGFNRYRLIPQTADAARTAPAVRALGRSVRVEMVLGTVVLVLAALLTAMVPAANLAAGPQVFSLQSIADGIRFDLWVDPYPTVPGNYTFQILLWNVTSGQPYDEGRNGTLTFTLLNSTVSPQTVDLLGPHGNHYFVTTPAMSQLGVWRIDVRLSRGADVDLYTRFHIALLGGA